MFQNQFEEAVSNVFRPKVPVPCANPITHNESSTLLDFAALQELQNCLIPWLRHITPKFCFAIALFLKYEYDHDSYDRDSCCMYELEH